MLLKKNVTTAKSTQDMLVPIADLKASIELFHREVIVTNPHFRNTSCSCCQDCETCPQGVHLPHLALPVQAASPPWHAQAPHQQGEILKHRTTEILKH